MKYLVRNAGISDLEAIMTIEKASFADPIMEEEAVFADRLRTASPYTFVLCASEEYSAAKEGYTAAGYFSSERWKGTTFSTEDFALGHSAAERHCLTGSVLYISSFALAPALRGTKITAADRCAVLNTTPILSTAADSAAFYEKPVLKQSNVEGVARFFFRTVLNTITAAHTGIERIVLVVHEDWAKAIRIYESQGFYRTGIFQRFAGFGDSSAFVYEKTLK